MKKIVSYDKLSKKEKRKIDATRRTKWSDFGIASPQTKVIPDKKKKTAEMFADIRIKRKEQNYDIN